MALETSLEGRANVGFDGKPKAGRKAEMALGRWRRGALFAASALLLVGAIYSGGVHVRSVPPPVTAVVPPPASAPAVLRDVAAPPPKPQPPISLPVPAAPAEAKKPELAPLTPAPAVAAPRTPEPPTKPAAQAAANPLTTPTLAGVGVAQIGAYPSRREAEAALARATARDETLRGRAHHVEAVQVGHGSLYRAQFRGFASMAEAAAACLTVRQAGGECFTKRR